MKKFICIPFLLSWLIIIKTAFVSVYPRAQSLFEQLEAVAERFYD
jgi:hypothetical protein